MRKFPLSDPLVDPPSLRKMTTLEFLFLHEGWHESSKIKADPDLRSISQEPSADRSIQMRLVRYCRQGLVRRKRVGHGYAYHLTPKGEDRLFYLWEKFGVGKVEHDMNEEELSLSEFVHSKARLALENRLDELNREDADLTGTYSE